MPSTHIDYALGRKAIQASKDSFHADGSCVVSSSVGLFLLDIQGELSLPFEPSSDSSMVNSTKVTVDEIYKAIKFGKLILDRDNLLRATLFIGKSQRLLGKIENLPKPVGVLVVPSNSEMNLSQPVKLIDIVYKKLIFDERPLPIM